MLAQERRSIISTSTTKQNPEEGRRDSRRRDPVEGRRDSRVDVSPPAKMARTAESSGKGGVYDQTSGASTGRHQADPEAMEKLLREPQGGYSAPKGGWQRWINDQKGAGAFKDHREKGASTDRKAGGERENANAEGMREGVDEQGREWKRPGEGGVIAGPGRIWGADTRDGLVPHEGWRPSVGYSPVDTTSVDVLRPVMPPLLPHVPTLRFRRVSLHLSQLSLNSIPQTTISSL